MKEKSTLTLMVGLPGSGKTTLAKRLEEETGAVRFTPDEWHIFLFGDDFHDPQQHQLHDSRHDRVEELMWSLGKELLQKGVSVILDFGFWAKEQREERRHAPPRLDRPHRTGGKRGRQGGPQSLCKLFACVQTGPEFLH